MEIGAQNQNKHSFPKFIEALYGESLDNKNKKHSFRECFRLKYSLQKFISFLMKSIPGWRNWQFRLR